MCLWPATENTQNVGFKKQNRHIKCSFAFLRLVFFLCTVQVQLKHGDSEFSNMSTGAQV